MLNMILFQSLKLRCISCVTTLTNTVCITVCRDINKELIGFELTSIAVGRKYRYQKKTTPRLWALRKGSANPVGAGKLQCK